MKWYGQARHPDQRLAVKVAVSNAKGGILQALDDTSEVLSRAQVGIEDDSSSKAGRNENLAELLLCIGKRSKSSRLASIPQTSIVLFSSPLAPATLPSCMAVSINWGALFVGFLTKTEPD